MWEDYRAKRKEYDHNIRKAEREAWKEFTSQSTKMIYQSKLNKIIFVETKPALGTLQSDNG